MRQRETRMAVEKEGIEWRNGKESTVGAHIPTLSSIEKYTDFQIVDAILFVKLLR